MRSLQFPKMFNTNSSNVIAANEYNKTTLQNAKLVLLSERGELQCDPYFGIRLKEYLFDQNSPVLKDAIIDTIYVQLALFIPQLKVSRNDIDIIQDKEKGKLYCKFTGISQIDYQPNSYNIVLFEESNMV